MTKTVVTPDNVGGVHVHARLLRADEDSRQTCVQINIFPLPDDEKLHYAISMAVRDIVNFILQDQGITDGSWREVPPAKGGVQ